MTQDPGPGTKDPRPRTWDLRPKTQDPGLQNLGPRDFELFYELQNKTLKSKKSFTSKRDNAKYPFTYFSIIKIIGFFFSS